MRRGLPLLAALLLAGCLPHYRHPSELAAERDRVEAAEAQHPDDPAYPKALYAIHLDMAESCTAEGPPLVLTEAFHTRVAPEKRGKTSTCCLGGLTFAADLLVVTPLRAIRTVVTMPMAWASRARYEARAEEDLARWKVLEVPK